MGETHSHVASYLVCRCEQIREIAFSRSTDPSRSFGSATISCLGSSIWQHDTRRRDIETMTLATLSRRCVSMRAVCWLTWTEVRLFKAAPTSGCSQSRAYVATSRIH